jgi:hypothetical protein
MTNSLFPSTQSPPAATNIADVGEGRVFMKKWLGAAAIMVVAGPAFAGTTAEIYRNHF